MPSAAPPAENGAPRSELEQLQLRAGQVTDEVSIFCLWSMDAEEEYDLFGEGALVVHKMV